NNTVKHHLLHSFPTRRSSDLKSNERICRNQIRFFGQGFIQLLSMFKIRQVKGRKLEVFSHLVGYFKSKRIMERIGIGYHLLSKSAFEVFLRSEEHTSELQSREK